MKTSGFICFLFLIITSFPVSSQGLLDEPEGIFYHAAEKCYFISNVGDGRIIKVDSMLNEEVFYEGLNIPIGIYIVGDSMYVNGNDPAKITCIRLSDGQLVEEILIPEVSSLSNMDYDPRSGYLYIIGQLGRMLKLNTSTHDYHVFVSYGNMYEGTQTCIIDTVFDKIYVFGWPMAYIREVNLHDSSDITAVVHPQVDHIIDAVKGPGGKIYVTSWNGDKVCSFDDPPNSGGELYSTGFDQPCGIEYNPELDQLVVCNNGNNTLTFIDVATGMDDPVHNQEKLHLFPNPAHNTVNYSLAIEAASFLELKIYDLHGRCICEDQVLTQNNFCQGRIDISHIPVGTYLLGIYADNRLISSSRFIKR